MDEHRSGHDMILPRPDARTPTAGSTVVGPSLEPAIHLTKDLPLLA
jgi:hypothetical protein